MALAEDSFPWVFRRVEARLTSLLRGRARPLFVHITGRRGVGKAQTVRKCLERIPAVYYRVDRSGKWCSRTVGQEKVNQRIALGEKHYSQFHKVVGGDMTDGFIVVFEELQFLPWFYEEALQQLIDIGNGPRAPPYRGGLIVLGSQPIDLDAFAGQGYRRPLWGRFRHRLSFNPFVPEELASVFKHYNIENAVTKLHIRCITGGFPSSLRHLASRGLLRNDAPFDALAREFYVNNFSRGEEITSYFADEFGEPSAIMLRAVDQFGKATCAQLYNRVKAKLKEHGRSFSKGFVHEQLEEIRYHNDDGSVSKRWVEKRLQELEYHGVLITEYPFLRQEKERFRSIVHDSKVLYKINDSRVKWMHISESLKWQNGSLCRMEEDNEVYGSTMDRFFKDYVKELVLFRQNVSPLPLREVRDGKLLPMSDAPTITGVLEPSRIHISGAVVDIDLVVSGSRQSDVANCFYAGSAQLLFDKHFEPLPSSQDDRSLRSQTERLKEYIGQERERTHPKFRQLEDAKVSYVVVSPEISEEDALKLAKQPGHSDILFMSLNDLLVFPPQQLPQLQQRNQALPPNSILNSRCTIM